jgi:hypothetical protein
MGRHGSSIDHKDWLFLANLLNQELGLRPEFRDSGTQPGPVIIEESNHSAVVHDDVFPLVLLQPLLTAALEHLKICLKAAVLIAHSQFPQFSPREGRVVRKMLRHSGLGVLHLVSCTSIYTYVNVHANKEMKRTAERSADDDAFIVQFSSALKRAYEKAKREGTTDQAFAVSVGVERPQLNRYLDGESMPSVRTVAFAYREYGIAIPYNRVLLQGALPARGGRRKPEPLTQMVLPFTIQTEKAAARVDLKLDSVSARKFAFRLIVDQAG